MRTYKYAITAAEFETYVRTLIATIGDTIPATECNTQQFPVIPANFTAVGRAVYSSISSPNDYSDFATPNSTDTATDCKTHESAVGITIIHSNNAAGRFSNNPTHGAAYIRADGRTYCTTFNDSLYATISSAFIATYSPPNFSSIKTTICPTFT